jgi:hypothetical protein
MEERFETRATMGGERGGVLATAPNPPGRPTGSPSNATIYIDESGDPGLTSKTTVAAKPYFVYGFVYCEDPRELRKRLRRLLKKMRLRKRYPPHLSELKFYLPYSDLKGQGYSISKLDTEFNTKMPMIRTAALGLIDRHATATFAAIVDKRKAAMSWTSEHLGNFAFAQTLMVNVLNVVCQGGCPLVVYDKGRLSPANSYKFRAYLREKESYFAAKGSKKYTGTLSAPIEVSSVSEPGVWAADLVAGAYYHKYANHDATYANMLPRTRTGSGERLYWP